MVSLLIPPDLRLRCFSGEGVEIAILCPAVERQIRTLRSSKQAVKGSGKMGNPLKNGGLMEFNGDLMVV